MFWQYRAAFLWGLVFRAEWQRRLVGLDPVGVGLADAEVAADQQLRVVYKLGAAPSCPSGSAGRTARSAPARAL